MCNKRIVSRKNFIDHSISILPSRHDYKSKMIVSDNFKLMHIIATQKIAHYSVNFDQIQKSFTLLVV